MCDCYRAAAEAGDGTCDGACVQAMFNDYGRLTDRCFGFDAFQGAVAASHALLLM